MKKSEIEIPEGWTRWTGGECQEPIYRAQQPAASSQPPVAGDVDALVDTYRELIYVLAEIVGIPPAGVQRADEVISRPRVMACVERARTSLDRMSGRLQSLRLTPPRSDAPAGGGVAMPEPHKPAGNAIDGLLATARPFLAEELLLKQGYTWSGIGWAAPAAKHEGETRHEKTTRVRTGLREHAKRFRDHIELAQEIHGTAPAGGGVAMPEPAFRLLWKHGEYKVTVPNIGDTDVYTADQLRAYGDARESAALARLVPVAEYMGRDAWGRAVIHWREHEHPRGTQLYTLTPSTGTEESGA